MELGLLSWLSGENSSDKPVGLFQLRSGNMNIENGNRKTDLRLILKTVVTNLLNSLRKNCMF